jgi:hypothetical protein
LLAGIPEKGSIPVQALVIHWKVYRTNFFSTLIGKGAPEHAALTGHNELCCNATDLSYAALNV